MFRRRFDIEAEFVRFRRPGLVGAHDGDEGRELEPALVQLGVGAIAVVVEEAFQEAAAVIGPVGQAGQAGILCLGDVGAEGRPVRTDVAGPDDAAVSLRAGGRRAAENDGTRLRIPGALVIEIGLEGQEREGVVDVGALARMIDGLGRFALGLVEVEPPGVDALAGQGRQLGRQPRLHAGMGEVHQLAAVIAGRQGLAVAVGGEQAARQGVGEVRRIAADHRALGRQHDVGAAAVQAGDPVFG